MADAKITANHRIVILRGPEPFLRDAYTQQLIEALETEHGEVGRFDYDGRTAAAADILDELRSYGLLQSYKLVILDHGDKFLATKDEDPGGKSNRSLLEGYAAAPLANATLLIRAETWRPGRLDKAVEKVGTIIKCDAPNAATATKWCAGRARRAHGTTIEPDAAALLVERIGTALGRLDAELGKLAAFRGEGEPIRLEDVARMVELTREEQAWVIQSAVLKGPAAAIGTLRELLEVSRQPEVLVTWALLDLLKKIHAAAQGLRCGTPAAALAKELRLWGDARQTVLAAARRHEPRTIARLLQSAVDADRATKTGRGKSDRTLEALTVTVADTLV